jgi:transcriptional regulator with PAS, ATPase and Fis domain
LLGARPSSRPQAVAPAPPVAAAARVLSAKRGRPTKTDHAAVKRALEAAQHDRAKAAELLGISLRTLTRHLRG